jgi:nanoRNase/pAp phosphatase (c-di-AMP/oligoRNAs hydrolase)
MDNSFGSIINSANSTLILLPTKPFFDQVAAGLSLYLSLKEKKDASISCPSPMVVEFNRLVGVNKVTQELGNKNLVVRLVDYPAENIERVSYDIENSEFRLTIIPKPGFPSPKKEQANLGYSGVSADTVILIGGANKSHFPAITSSKDLAGAKIIHIGIRALSTSPESGIMSFAKPASSCSEIVANLIKESGFVLDVDIATNLLAGIEDGSNKFSGSEVVADTFQTVADLMRVGGVRKQRFSHQNFQKGKFPSGSIPGKKIVEEKKEAPKDWLEPKIYKGTSIS